MSPSISKPICMVISNRCGTDSRSFRALARYSGVASKPVGRTAPTSTASLLLSPHAAAKPTASVNPTPIDPSRRIVHCAFRSGRRHSRILVTEPLAGCSG
jgi:hypothetical protein